MRNLSVVIGLAAAFLVPGRAGADELTATLGQPLFETSHGVDVRLADGVARYTVRRVFANPGKIADEAVLAIELPYGAAVTGLRIRARHRWHTGELMEREAAARMYRELTGFGPHRPKDPALLEWVWAGRVQLQIFPVLPGATSTVEYTLTVPTRYRAGRALLSYPRPAAGSPLAPPVLRVQPGHGDATTLITVDSRRVAPDSPVVLSPTVPPLWVGEGEPDEGAAYATSRLDIEATGVVRKATLDLDVEHTFKGDLRIELVTPAGHRVVVHDRAESGDNDVRGKFVLALPAGTRAEGAWHLVASDHAGLDTGTINSWTLILDRGAPDGVVTATAGDTPRFVPDAPADGDQGQLALIEIDAPAIDVVAARLGRVEAGPGKQFVRLEIDAARELGTVPRGAQVVFVIDASRSIGEDGIAAQLALARAYLSHVPDAHAQVILFRRHAAAATAWFPAGQFDGALAEAGGSERLVPGNGSALEEGLRAAAAALRGRTGPARIVVFSDGLLRDAFANAMAVQAMAGAPPDTIVHVVIPDPDGSEPTERRDDEHDLAAIAAARAGILLQMRGLGGATGKQLGDLALGLVRPIRIDHFQVSGADLSDGGEVPDALTEGTGYRSMVALGRAPTEVALVGRIWSRPFRRAVVAGADFSRATAGWVFGEDEHDDLTPAEMMRVAVYGRAVSPVTSYLAIEPGVRPSTIGIERGEAGGMGMGRVGMGAGGGGAGRELPPDLAELLAPAARRCRDQHGTSAGRRISVQIETTIDEIVDVSLRGAADPTATCVVEAIWAFALPSSYIAEHDHFEVVL